MTDIVLEILKAIQTDIAQMKDIIAKLDRGQSLLAQDVRMLRSAMNDMARTRVSAGEIEALHTDVNDLRDRVLALETKKE